jgi:hypothetical protein
MCDINGGRGRPFTRNGKKGRGWRSCYSSGRPDIERECSSSDAPADHYQVYSGTVRVGTIYKTRGNPAGNQWYWGLNGVQNGPGPFNGFVRTLEDAKAEFAAAWGAWLKAAGLNEDTPTAQLKDSDSGPA